MIVKYCPICGGEVFPHSDLRLKYDKPECRRKAHSLNTKQWYELHPDKKNKRPKAACSG